MAGDTGSHSTLKRVIGDVIGDAAAQWSAVLETALSETYCGHLLICCR